MRIGSNIPSLSIANRLTQTTKAIQRSLERLSSGARVNSARDDAAAFSMSIGLDSQVRGLKQGLLNINQAQGMLQVADSAYQSQLDLIQRMREIAVQASNGTLSTSDRSALNEELSTLVEEFQRISTSTEWNGHKLLDGSFGTLSVFSGLSSTASIDQAFENSQSNQIFRKTAGTGAYSAGQTVVFSQIRFRAIEFGDVNNDGNVDMVGADVDTDVLEVRLGNGDGTFQAGITSFANYVAENTLNLADVNGDGLLDAITPSSSGGVSVNFGLGDGRFQYQNSYGTAGSDRLTMADIDGDGDNDAIGASGALIAIYLNNGTGVFSLSKTLVPSNTPSLITVGDFNNDGRVDIAATAGANLSVLLNQGSLNFSETVATGLAGIATQESLVSGDIDNDGDLDLAYHDTANSRFLIFKNSGTGTFVLSTSIATPESVVGSRLVDVNNDSLLDLVSAPSFHIGLMVSFNQGNGSFSAIQTSGFWEVAGSVIDSAFADINNDGIVDLVQADRNDPNFLPLIASTSDVTALVDLTVSTQAKAQKLIGILDTALTNIMDRRADISALHNRLDSEASASLMLSENLSDALSKSKDVDVAEETAELVRNQILQQAQIAVLAQANVNAQLILELFRI